jgi:Putative lumazine-binding
MKKNLCLFGILGGMVAGNAGAEAPSTACPLPAQAAAIPAAIDAAITGPTEKDRSCMKELFLPEARLVVVAAGTDGTPTYTVLTLDDWTARVKSRGHAMLEEKQIKYAIESFGGIAHFWSTYALHSDGKQIARGVNSIQAMKTAGGWRVMGIMWQAESAATPLPKELLP